MSVADLKYWKDKDVAKWLKEELRSRMFDNVIYDNRLDGRKILEFDHNPRKLTRFLDKLEDRGDYSRDDVEDLESQFKLLLEDYNKARRSSSRRGRSSRRRDRSESPRRRNRDESPRNERDRSGTPSPRRRENRDRRDRYENPRRRSRGRGNGRKYIPTCWEVWEELDIREKKYITWFDFYKYVFDTLGTLAPMNKRILKKKLDPDSRSKITEETFFEVLPRNDEFKAAITSAVDFHADPSDFNQRESRSKSCPKNEEDVWDLIDRDRKDRISERRWTKFLKDYCSWVNDDDGFRIFEYLDRHNDRYIERREFLRVFKRRNFERDLEELISLQDGRSRRERRLSNRNAWKKMDKDNSGVIRAKEFKDLCMENGISRSEARECWRILDDRDKGKVRRNDFLSFFPRGENFLDSFRKLTRRRNGRSRSIDFASLSSSQLERWLKYLGRPYDRYIRKFNRNRISGKELLYMPREELEDLLHNREDAKALRDKVKNVDPDELRMLFLADRKMEEYDNTLTSSSEEEDFSWIRSQGRGRMKYDDRLTVEQAKRSSNRPRPRSNGRRERRYSDEYY